MRDFENINPFALFVYFACVTVIPMFFANGYIYIISLIGSLSYYFYKNKSNNISVHIFSFFLFLAIALVNPIVSHNGKTVLLVVNNQPITLEAIIYGFYSSVMIISILYWFRIFSDIMTSDKILYIFDRFSPKFALIISMALRYIPLFKVQAKKIEHTQKQMGELNEDTIIEKIKGKIKVFSVMVTWTIENGIITAESMDSRGYGIGTRSRFTKYSFSFSDIFFLLLSLILFAFSVFFIKDSKFIFYPEYFVSTTNLSVFGYLLYGSLALMPLIIEVKENLKWKLLEQKI